MKPDFSSLISKQSALALVFSKWTPTQQTELVPLSQAVGRVLAEDQFAGYDLPVVRASTMDGVAVQSHRFAGGMPDTSDWKLGRDFVRADTGDDFDDAFDAVIAIEDVELLEDGGIRFTRPLEVKSGYQVKGQGADLKKGALLVPKGTRIDARALGALAMGGMWEIPVVKKPRVAFIPTGSELVPAGSPLRRGENFDSNSLLAQAMLEEMGAEPLLHPIVRDDPQALRDALQKVLPESDIVLINAGTSKGGEDYSYRLLEENGELLFHGVAAVPGRPMSIGVLGEKLLVNLSGPSFAAFYSLDWLVKALVARFLGVSVPVRETVRATLTQDLGTPPFFSQMAPFHLELAADGTYLATPISLRGPRSQGSAAALMADGVYITTPGQAPLKAGTEVEIELLKNRAEITNTI
jgi:molybdopterin molybdotransferase/putative molybdopterin biosynthesis protein